MKNVNISYNKNEDDPAHCLRLLRPKAAVGPVWFDQISPRNAIGQPFCVIIMNATDMSTVSLKIKLF